MTPPSSSRYQRSVTLLVDYKGQYYCPLPGRLDTMSLTDLSRHLAEAGWRMDVRTFPEIDLRAESWADRFVFYTSSQDRDLHYKGYIEDVVLALTMAGAVVVPDFAKLRAHHNKVFMELLRDVTPDDEIRTLRSRHFGCLEELRAAIDDLRYPFVLKAASTDLSRGVVLVKDRDEALRHAATLSASFHPADAVSRLWREATRDEYVAESLHRRKFIVQELVPGASEDEKVLVFGDRYYWVHRQARPGDFRASGSGMPLAWPEEAPAGLLQAARRMFERFDVPYASIDLVHDGRTWHLIEFQFLRFGVAGILRAPHYFQREGDEFRKVDEKPTLEETFAQAMVGYLERFLTSGRDNRGFDSAGE